jgi:hypothetical protein
MATASPLGPAESPDSAEAARRVARVGRAAIRSQHPSSRGRSTEALRPVQVRRAHIRTPTRHRAPNQEPGRILIPGDGAAGDQGAQNRPACAAIAATRRLRPVPSQRFLALWCQAHTPSCSRQVTSTSIRMVKPGPASAPRGHAPLRTDTLSFGSNNFRSNICSWVEMAATAYARSDHPVRRGGHGHRHGLSRHPEQSGGTAPCPSPWRTTHCERSLSEAGKPEAHMAPVPGGAGRYAVGWAPWAGSCACSPWWAQASAGGGGRA